MEKICENPECGNKFEGQKSKKFCSNKCRFDAWKKRNPNLGNVVSTGPTTLFPVIEKPAPKKSSLFAPSSNIDLHTQLSIQMLQKESDRWEDAFKEEKKKHEKVKEEKEKLEKEFSSFKHDQELSSIRDAKPTGLAGLSENPLIKELIPHVGEGLGDILKAAAARLMGGSGSTQTALGAAPGELDEVAKWVDAQSDETKTFLRELLVNLSMLKEDKAIQGMIVRLISVMRKGTAMGGPAMSSTGTFG